MRPRCAGAGGVLGGQAFEQQWHQPTPDRVDDADTNGAGDLVAHGREVGSDRVELALDPAGSGGDRLPLAGEMAIRPIDERTTQLALEPRDVGGDVGLHGVEPPGGTRERAVLGDGQQNLQLSHVHVDLAVNGSKA